MAKYTVNCDGFLANEYKRRGDVVDLHPNAARYLIAPYSDQLLEGEVNLSGKPSAGDRRGGNEGTAKAG